MQIQSFLKGKAATLHSGAGTSLIARCRLLSNHTVIPGVIQMKLLSAFFAGCDTRRQQVKDNQEHGLLGDTFALERRGFGRKPPRPIRKCCGENFISCQQQTVWRGFTLWVNPVGAPILPVRTWLCLGVAVLLGRVPGPSFASPAGLRFDWIKAAF